MPKNRTDHRGDIDAVADGAINLFPEDRIERGADGERQIITIAKVSQRHSHQGVHRPAGEAVVE